MPRLTNSLLERAARAAQEHAKLAAEITEAFNERYGKTHSDVDCDELIESLDYGLGGTPTVAHCDKEMAKCGAEKIKRESGSE